MNKLETSYGRFHIYVNCLSAEDENLIHLSFVDKNNKTHVVLMRQVNSKWVFAHPEALPHWIISLEEQFDTIATKELTRNYQSSTATPI